MLHLFWHKRPMINNALKMLLLVSGLFLFADAMLLPIFALFVEQIGGSVTTAANAYAVFWMTAGLLTFAAGRIEGRMKRIEVAIMWSMYVMAAGYILYYFIKQPEMLYAVMVILGIGNAIFWPAFHSLYSEHVDREREAMEWSFYDGLAYIIPAIGAALGGWLVEIYGFNLIFIIMAVIAFSLGTLIVILPRNML